MDPQLNVIVFLGSTRDERLGIRPAKYIIELLNERKHSVTFFGPFGGIRAAASIRAMLSDLGMVSVPEAMYCPMVAESFDTNGIPISDRIIKNGKKLVSNLEWYGCALKQHLKVNGMPK
ncbi:Uncharacterised protein r2_g1316 [Pycnogonum litorale]